MMRSKITAAALLLAVLAVSVPVSALDWPFRIESGDTVITIYTPQIETFEGDMLTARAAVSISVPQVETPVFGAVWFESYALTDRESRTVVLSDVNIIGARFPSTEGERSERFRQLAEEEIEDWELLMTLDEIKAALDYVDQKHVAAEGLNNDPPEIIFKDSPAVLVTIDGEPREKDLEDSGLRYVENTAFFIVFDKNSGTWYLRGGPWWYASKKADSGYMPVDRVPDEVSRLAEAAEKAAAEAESEARAEGEEEPEPVNEFEGLTPPEIIIMTTPAELIVSDGEPEFALIEDTDLLYMTNTDSDVFMDTKGQTYYILVSGRWFAAKTMSGDWKYVASDTLPADFAKIDPGSRNGHVLVSVAGTDQARDAVLDMYVPQTAEVDRSEAEVDVTYDGDPKFEKIEDTDMTYAVNTSSSVIRAGDMYYCCDEAVWFVSQSATGPWNVCVEVPSVIYTIPPSCPVYNVIYVHVYDYSPDVVYVGYTPGYTCSYVYGGTVVYGTGWYYRPWYGRYYYPRNTTWGFRVHYNPWTGWGFSFGVRYGGAYGWFRVGWGSPYRYWGPRGYWGGYNRGYRHGYYHGYNRGMARGYAAGYRAGQTRPASRNLYKNRSSGVKRTGEVRTAQKRPSSGTPSTRQQSTRQKTPSASQTRNNAYVDRNGNVYRDNKGTWERQGSSKTAKQPDRASKSELDRYKSSREKDSRSSESYQREKSNTQRDTRQKSTQQRDTRQKSTGQRSTRQTQPSQQRSTRTQSSGQRNTRSNSSRRTTRSSGKRR